MQAANEMVYSAASITNAASGESGFLAPNTIASLYGKNLAYATKALTTGDLTAGMMPTVLPGTGVRVSVGGLLANLFYVSPTQINFLVPAELLAGPTTVFVTRDGVRGPIVNITLSAAAPAIFQMDAATAIATHGDGSVVTSDAPATPGEIVVLYATGLGQMIPPVLSGELAAGPLKLQAASSFQAVVGGKLVGKADVLYTGAAPGFAGLYQINLRLPADTPADPEIRIGVASALSRAGLKIYVTR